MSKRKAQVPDRRSYSQFCGLARALDIVGERWTLLIVRDLLLGPRRYGELLDGLPGITTNLLAKRLREMEAERLIERVTEHGATLYRLSDIGLTLEPAVMALARFGGRYLDKPRRGDVLNIAWGLLSLKRRYVGGKSLVAGFEIDTRRFELVLSNDYLQVQEREAVRPDVVVRGDVASVRAWLFGGVPAEQLVTATKLVVSGRREAWQVLCSAFENVS